MIHNVMKGISCMLVDVIRETLARCDYRECDVVCNDYLNAVSHECPIVFHNEQYELLWHSLFKICSNTEEIMENNNLSYSKSWR